ncbi:MAG: MoxR family ATPase [Elusimicrobiales bacterium]|nr:MoxR family ATPase [Elusimicrobiales bacterium]
MSGQDLILENKNLIESDKLDGTNYEYKGFARSLGIFGYENIETLLIIGLITQDPLILIGDMGSGKTHILNNISKLLGLNHKHYNASMISFDDIVGFPYPFKNGGENKMKIEYIMTPATVWDAESVLIDEINRCKPEVQNKLFSLIYEKKLQGIEIRKLVYRWSAMNPYRKDEDENVYLGVEPLDKALADRFSLFIQVPKWSGINENTKREILKNMIEPDIKASNNFIDFINKKREEFQNILQKPPLSLINYIAEFSKLANDAKIMEISVRRAKIIMKNISALLALTPNPWDEDVYNVFKSSIPDICWNDDIKWDKLNLIHKSVYQFNRIELFKDNDMENFMEAKGYIEKANMLINLKSKEKRSLIVKWAVIKAKEGDYDYFIFIYLIFSLVMKGVISLNADACEEFFGYMKNISSSVNMQKKVELKCDSEIIEIISENKFLKDFFISFLNCDKNQDESIEILKKMKEFIDYFKKEGL